MHPHNPSGSPILQRDTGFSGGGPRSGSGPPGLVLLVATWLVVGLAPTVHTMASRSDVRVFAVAVSTAVAVMALLQGCRRNGSVGRVVAIALATVAVAVAVIGGGRWMAIWIAAGAVLAVAALPLLSGTRSDRSLSSVVAVAGAVIATELGRNGGTTWQPPLAVLLTVPIARICIDRSGPLDVARDALRSAAARVLERLLVWLRRDDVRVGIVMAALTAPIYWRLIGDPTVVVSGVNDYQGHVIRAELIRFWPPRVASPHFLFQLAIRLLWPLVGVQVAVTSVLTVSTGFLGSILVGIGRRQSPDGRALGRYPSMLLPFAYVLAESPALLIPTAPDWWGRAVGFDTNGTGPGYVPFHVWGSPTGVLLLPFAFLTVRLLLDTFDEMDAASPQLVIRPWELAWVTLVGTAVKPAVSLCLLPAALIYMLVTRRVTARTIRTIGLWCLLPGAAVIAFQMWFLRSGVSSLETESWRIHPFWILSRAGLDRPAAWPLVVFLGLCWWAGRSRYLRDPWVLLTSIAVLVSLVPAFVLQETGAKAEHGNLAQSFFFCLVLLTVGSMRFAGLELADVARGRRESGAAPPLWSACMVLFGSLCLLAGLLSYLDAVGVLRVA